MVGDNDWDLYAVVRSCNSAAAAAGDQNAGGDTLSSLASLTFADDGSSLSDMSFESKQLNGFHELHQAYMSFLPSTATAAPATVNSSVSAVQYRYFERPPLDFRPSVSNSPEKHHPSPPPYVAPLEFSPMAVSRIPKSRKRKNQQKKTVCHVTEENLSMDMWAWRKYGQKPIKGSPYPRNYYRCSSSKGCGARKQVERSNSDPEIFIVTYTGDHTHPRPTHRNSLAGSSRNKVPTKNPATGDPDQPSSASVAGSPASSPATTAEDPAVESDDGEEDILIPNLAMRDEIFVGLEELGCSHNPATAGGGSHRS